MCLSIPGKIISREGYLAEVSFSGVVMSNVSIFFCPEACVGDFVLVHAGNALQVVTEEDVGKIAEAWDELRDGGQNGR
jgi:hydrogenase expression/formation protein HypC